MSGIKDQHELDEMRKRLYSRGFDVQSTERHTLTDKKIDVARNWSIPPAMPSPTASIAPTTPAQAAVSAPTTPTSSQDVRVPPDNTDVEKPRSRRYRKYVLLGSLIFLLIGVAAASVFIFWGGNRISGDNISFNIAGPTTIGSSETLSFQVAITNQNTVAIENATLVLRYPDGTRTVSEPIKNVYEDRIDVGRLNPGEAKNIPVQVAVFGKENDLKDIKATFEYRVTDSDGVFYKEAAPLRFQIISSPITLQVASIGKVAAGQPIEVVLTVKSNTARVLNDILISASYPNGFAYKESDPKPVYNQNVWKISELKPETSTTITIKGVVSGLTEERFGVHFNAGIADPDNPFIVGSMLAETRTEFVIERPFIAVDISIGGDADRQAVLEPGSETQVAITIKNTLSEAVYDMVVEVVPDGNALTQQSIDDRDGFYDSNKNLIRWETANKPDLEYINPGDSRMVNFNIKPSANVGTASFEVTVNVYARRVAEASAQEQLIGSVAAEAKYASAATVGGQALHMTGPLPPTVGQTTTYLITLVVEAGNNNITNAVVTSALPAHIEWLNDFSGLGSIEYNLVSKQITWNVGDVVARERRELSFSVALLPSVSQVGITPVLLNSQTLVATDRFTGTPLTADASLITTELSKEAGYQEGNGQVVN